MKQITEDYVSYEIAQLLKEKGFDGDCDYWYDEYGGMCCSPSVISVECWCPSQSLALKWLREEHNIYIDILTYTTGKNIQFRWVGYEKGRLFSQEEGKTIYFDSYEESCEASLLYVLKNLI